MYFDYLPGNAKENTRYQITNKINPASGLPVITRIPGGYHNPILCVMLCKSGNYINDGLRKNSPRMDCGSQFKPCWRIQDPRRSFKRPRGAEVEKLNQWRLNYWVVFGEPQTVRLTFDEDWHYRLAHLGFGPVDQVRNPCPRHWPSSSKRWSTVVSEGTMPWQMSLLSYPMTETSSGTLMPDSESRLIAPAAM